MARQKRNRSNPGCTIQNLNGADYLLQSFVFTLPENSSGKLGNRILQHPSLCHPEYRETTALFYLPSEISTLYTLDSFPGSSSIASRALTSDTMASSRCSVDAILYKVDGGRYMLSNSSLAHGAQTRFFHPLSDA